MVTDPMRTTIARWLLDVDPDATRRGFAQRPIGTGCTCADCRNFVAAVMSAFPSAFRTLAHDLGIDITKPAELCHYCREPSGLHLTGGWFHLVGSVVSGEDVMHWSNGASTYRFEELVPGFEFGFSKHLSLVPEVFAGLPVIQLEFQTRVPWVIAEPESV
jgi:hypothetical protein